ncbi:poly(ribitol-phosphate) beta-N-acetylglucosaminyltransferase [Brevibacterium pityocampae]
MIPAKDAEAYISETLESVTYQDLPVTDIEVLVIDDGSTDATVRIAESFTSRLPLLRIISNPGPRGPSAARNTGLEASTGQFITFIDSDDWYGRGHLRRLTSAMHALDVDFVRSDVVQVNGKIRVLDSAPVSRRGVRLKTHDFISHHFERTMVDFPLTINGMYSRRLTESGLLSFPEQFITAEDRYWNWKLFLADLTFAVVDSQGSFYRRAVAGSLTAVYDERQLGIAHVFDTLLREIEGNPDYLPFLPKAAHNMLALYHWHWKRKDEIPPPLFQSMTDSIVKSAAHTDPAVVDAVWESFNDARRKDLHRVHRRIAAERTTAS